MFAPAASDAEESHCRNRSRQFLQFFPLPFFPPSLKPADSPITNRLAATPSPRKH